MEEKTAFEFVMPAAEKGNAPAEGRENSAEAQEGERDGVSRRALIIRGAALAVGATGLFKFGASEAQACDVTGVFGNGRAVRARQNRQMAAQAEFRRPVSRHLCNGDEELYSSKFANFSKGLPHDSLGEVNQSAYNRLLTALRSGRQADFENIPMGGSRRLTNPQAGAAMDMEGPDAQCLNIPPAPKFASAQRAAEFAELAWMALLRDVPFTDWQSDNGIGAAVADLNSFSDFRGPKVGGQVTRQTLFRGQTQGDITGPFVSQFMLQPIQYGTLTIDQRQTTAAPGTDHGTSFANWLQIQNGNVPTSDVFDSTRRYIRSMRDLATYVHFDALYEAYLNAALYLLSVGAPADAGNPYNNSQTQVGFGTFGGPHLLTLVCEVATRALKAVWFQKWYVHRNLRPEEFGGRLHLTMKGQANYPIHQELLNSGAAAQLFSRNGTWLLPLAFPEGSPTHPSYGAGHATVAGACVTILKAWFDESWVLPTPVEASADGLSLNPYTGGPLTVGGELDKIAANVAVGRNMAGVHWRADYTESIRLGEEIAISILREGKNCYNEPHSFSVTRFDGTTVTV